ncbi:MAG TPA: hypothetical protein VGR55_03540 [Candidatus Acidoferrum sp.]|nr:hypothetical protein [Candidatus Acidoferrum sp.]
MNQVELFPGPAAGEIAVLTEHFLLVVHFLGEVKVFDIGVSAGVVQPFAKLRVIVMKDFVVSIMLGKNALDALEKAFGVRELAMTETGIEPAFDPLRGEARFQDLLRRVGLEK